MILAVQIVAVDRIAIAVDLITFDVINKVFQHENTETRRAQKDNPKDSNH